MSNGRAEDKQRPVRHSPDLKENRAGGTEDEQTDSFVAQIDVFDVTANSVCASNVVVSFVVKNKYYGGNDLNQTTTINMSANPPPGSLTIQFQPNHQYQVRARWDCAAHEETGGYPAYNWVHPFALDVSLAVQSLAITFE